MYLLFDIGGTKTRFATSKDLQTLENIEHVSTPQNFEDAIKLFEEVIAKLAQGNSFALCAGGAPGPLNSAHTELLKAPNLPMWRGKPLAEALSKIVACPALVENDAAVAGLGEAVFGAGKGKKIAAYYTVSTGIGGARIVNSKIDVSAFGFEPGQQIIDADGTLYEEALIKGNLEAYVSGTALERRFGQKPHDITDQKVWDETAEWLAYGIFNGIVHWSPEIVICGGSMVLKQPGIDLEKVSAYLKKLNNIFIELPKLVPAKLGQDSALYGALALIQQVG